MMMMMMTSAGWTRTKKLTTRRHHPSGGPIVCTGNQIFDKICTTTRRICCKCVCVNRWWVSWWWWWYTHTQDMTIHIMYSSTTGSTRTHLTTQRRSSWAMKSRYSWVLRMTSILGPKSLADVVVDAFGAAPLPVVDFKSDRTFSWLDDDGGVGVVVVDTPTASWGRGGLLLREWNLPIPKEWTVLSANNNDATTTTISSNCSRGGECEAKRCISQNCTVLYSSWCG